MVTHQKSARVQVQVNGDGLLKYCHSLSQGERAFTCCGGRGLDVGKFPLKEMKAQAAADQEAVEEEWTRAERREMRREEKKAEESRMVEGFQPILDPNWFCSTLAVQIKRDLLRQQLVWHQVVGGDKGLPTGLFTGMNRERMKTLVVEALERWNRNVVTDKTKAVPDHGRSLKTSRAQVDDLMDADMALLSDGSELKLELIDKARLSLGNTKDVITNWPPLDLTHDPAPGPSNLLTSAPMTCCFRCKWDSINYSCSYDCVFTAFTWIYLHATEDWRVTWTGESLVMKILSHHFKTILHALKGLANNQMDW